VSDHLSRPSVATWLKRPTTGVSSELPPFMPLLGLAPDGVYIAAKSPMRWWALTSPFHPYHKSGGIFLLHFPWSHLHWELPSTLLYGARTFLVTSHAIT